MTTPDPGARRRVGLLATAVVFAVFAAIALWIDPVDVRRTPADPTAVPGFQSDEATYYLMGQSLARDLDLEYRHEDIARARAEFPEGPSGAFLRPGTTIGGQPDPVQDRLFFGKSFAYPLFAAPFVAVFGTNGFYLFNAALLALAFFCAFTFLSARSPVGVSLILAGGFVFPTVVPVYWSWIAPELFNCVLGLVAYFCWLYKLVAPPASSRWTAWLRGPGSDVAAALLIGLLTFSKPTNALLGVPMGLWWLWRGEWRRAVIVALTFVLSAGFWFGANVAISGDWNYQGGDRQTCYGTYPFETPDQGLDVCDDRSTSEALTHVWFDRDMFWTNLRANLGYFVAGRYGGVFAYFFPVVFGVLAFVIAGQRREAWQWLVLGGIVAQALLFLITQPYSYFGGGGSVGNRYFMGGYGVAVFLFPPIRSMVVSLIPWVVGGAFMAPLVLSPFDTSMRPGDPAGKGPLRLLPVERTNFSDLPVQTEGSLMLRWFGETKRHPGFQILYLDKNSYLKEADGGFWTRGRSRAEMLVRTNAPEDRLELTLRAGPQPTHVRIRIDGASADATLAAGQTSVVQLAPARGFPFKKPGTTSYIWHLSIEADNGSIPAERDGGSDTRFLGVRVTPLIIP